MFDFDFNTASVITQEPVRPPLPAYDAVERFRQAMFDAGLRPDEIADTSGLAMPERCPVADDRPGKKSGWYCRSMMKIFPGYPCTGVATIRPFT